MKLKIPYIPDDDDAKGIVVRVLSYDYYLKHFWLTFRDPYIEVEYQIAIRRQRLIKVCLIGVYCIIYGLHMFLGPHIYTLPPTDVMHYNINHLCYIFGSTWVIVGTLIITGAFMKNINNIVNLPMIMITIAMLIAITCIILNLRLLYSIPDEISKLPQITKDLFNFQSQLGIGMNHTYTIYCINIILILIYSTSILDVKQYLAVSGSITLIWGFVIYQIVNISNTDYKALYNLIGWRLGSLYVMGVNVRDAPSINLTQSHDQNMQSLEKLENIVKTVVPYEKSIFYLDNYNSNLAKYYIFIWISFLIILFYNVYNNEKMLRADFILRRVRSDKDEPRNLEIGIKIKNLNEINRTAEENLICKNNLKRWKESDSNTDEKDTDNNLNEKESTNDENIDLYELGSVLDGKTVRSLNSDSIFERDKNDIIESVKKIIPKSYTKSEISDNNNNAINDRQSDSHVPKSYTKSEISDNNNSAINDTQSDSHMC
mgnify:CR=1 FL=1